MYLVIVWCAAICYLMFCLIALTWNLYTHFIPEPIERTNEGSFVQRLSTTIRSMTLANDPWLQTKCTVHGAQNALLMQ